MKKVRSKLHKISSLFFLWLTVIGLGILIRGNQGGNDDENTVFADVPLEENTFQWECCFVAGTKITMADGSEKNIEDVAEGDRILSFDEKTKEHKETTISAVIAPMRDGVYSINNGLVKVTSDHPFYIKKADGTEGWGAIDPEASRSAYSEEKLGKILALEVGDSIRTIEKTWTAVDSLDHIDGEVQTYTAEGSEYHTFFANGLVAHNQHVDPGEGSECDGGGSCSSGSDGTGCGDDCDGSASY